MQTRWIVSALIVGLVASASAYGYWRYETRHPSTADGYTHADVIQMAAQVDGPVVALHVANHEHVTQGQLLLELDPRPFRIAVDHARAALDLVRQQNAAAQAAVEVAKADLDAAKAKLANARQTAERELPLVARGELPQSEGDQVKAARNAAAAEYAAAQAALARAQRERGDTGDANAALRAAKAALAQARLDLEHARVTAPASGTISQLELREGSMVQLGNPLFAIVQDGNWWVDANYEETDLERIHPGQPARVVLDLYPHHPFNGRVRSIDPASGVTFSLLPPENATGNWVKVTQRFPVRVEILDADPGHPLRIGASATVTIDTTSTDSADAS